jgi:glucosamine kinase
MEIRYLVGVDGGGSGTRARLARADGTPLASGSAGPSGLGLGIVNAWLAIEAAVAQAFAAAGLDHPGHHVVALALGVAGANNPAWAAKLRATQPGYRVLLIETDAYSTLVGAFSGQPGAVIALGTGSVGMARFADGTRREAGGWGFPSGDEGSGAWLGLRALSHTQKCLDGRLPGGDLARSVLQACGGSPQGLLDWSTRATQTAYAGLAPLVLAHAADDPAARTLVALSAREVESLALALDPAAQLPLALCGGLGQAMREHLAPALRARIVAPKGDSALGALWLIERTLARQGAARQSIDNTTGGSD